jgi:hypothetical protein
VRLRFSCAKGDLGVGLVSGQGEGEIDRFHHNISIENGWEEKDKAKSAGFFTNR